jgi:hypothetical protein
MAQHVRAVAVGVRDEVPTFAVRPAEDAQQPVRRDRLGRAGPDEKMKPFALRAARIAPHRLGLHRLGHAGPERRQEGHRAQHREPHD